MPESRSADSDTSRYCWRKSSSAVALTLHGQVVWQYNYDPQLAKPYFHPLATTTGQVLTWNQPQDHVWHHGLWFSWKFINGVNYWEHNDAGAPEGRTDWSDVQVVTRKDYSSSITMELRYLAADTEVALLERRWIKVSPPAESGDYRIDWTSTFTAIQPAKLDRTPPQPQAPGGYAGLSVRFADNFADRQAVDLAGPIADDGDRFRGQSGALEYNGVVGGAPAGLAILDSPANPRHPTPWYLIRAPKMSYVNAAFLHDEPLSLAAGEQFTLCYRVVVHNDRWNTADLQSAYHEFADTAASIANE
ncbi:MAG TPA: PmoA family protein [Lacipirellula sp.]